MNGDLYFDGKKYISASRAAKISGYVNDYIGQLCRDGKLECRMVGRSWYVGLESLIEHKKTYLTGTRSRGPRNVKTLAALAAKSEIISTPQIEQEASSLGSMEAGATALPSAIETLGQTEKIKTAQLSYPVFATPVANQKLSVTPSVQTSQVVEDFSPLEKRALRKPFVVQTARVATAVLALFVAILGFRFGLTVNPESQSIYATAWSGVSSQLDASVLDSVRGALAPVVATVVDTLRDWFNNSRQTIFVLSGGTTSAPTPSVTTASQTSDTGATNGPNTGMVVVPVTPAMDQQAVVTKVRNTFSDQVNVVPKGSDNGVITPVFKSSKSDGYLYVLVPINN